MITTSRLAKYYVPLDDDEKHQLEREVHRVVVTRDPKHTTFVAYRACDEIITRRHAATSARRVRAMPMT